MNFKIISPTRVEVDGTDVGNVVDFILANPAQKREIAQAFADWHGDHVKEDQRREKDLEDAKKALEAQCEAHRKEHQEKSAALAEASDFRAKEFTAAVQSAVSRFLGQSNVDETLKAKKRADLQAQLAAL